jgi:polyphenol oxidase
LGLSVLLQAASLSALPGIRHAFFTREGGVSEGIYASLNGGQGSQDRAGHVAENRARMAAALGVAPERLINAYQVHSAEVVVADAPWTREARPRVDAIVTRVPGLAIGVSTADCGPVLFADAEARVIGAAHAGWKGALGGVLENTIAAMEGLGANRARIVAALGPMIRPPSYEVGGEFVDRFRDADAQNARFFAPSRRDGHALFDLPAYIAERLRRAGIDPIEDVGVCTYADRRFFSYRRSVHRAEPDYGRHINALVLGE